MKVSRVLLRWYKSFNISYNQGGPDRHTTQLRPWNAIHVGNELADEFPFIEIPIESDITTIVGANESGKSHLLSAISKVITGRGIDGKDFRHTDLCRYSSFPEDIKSFSRRANIGLIIESDDGGKDIAAALKQAEISDSGGASTIAIVLGDPGDGISANIFIDNQPTPRKIGEKALEALRSALPKIQFIDARAALPDNLTYEEIVAALDSSSVTPNIRYSSRTAQQAAAFLSKLALSKDAHPADAVVKDLHQLQRNLESGRADVTDDAKLAITLLRDVLEIPVQSIVDLLQLPLSDRGYIDYYISDWNRRIVESLNLRKFWRQDDQAALVLRYRDGILYFDITDKTGATYTFNERSSGLRYFLSYYIQAKAMELSQRNRRAMVLMDEPDSFLSILGQKNLLAVFESLVSFESSAQTCQLCYTTHSPFLINQNFPRRVRVVTKQEAEEGTQYHGYGSARRYEPVRSALGVSCAQTLFMGATNIVLEGPTDQYLITEVVRVNAKPDTVSEWLDLNSVVLVSADGVDNVEKVLSASQWGDEPIPATVVLIDSDRPDVIGRITGSEQGSKKLIEREFVATLAELLEDDSPDVKFTTIEDVVPWPLYSLAISNYVQRWKPNVHRDNASTITTALGAVSSECHVKRAVKALQNSVGAEVSLDKSGVLSCVMDIVRAKAVGQEASIKLLNDRIQQVCGKLREMVESSRQKSSMRSIAHNVKRVIREFLLSRANGASIVDLDDLLQRIEREVRPLDDSKYAVLESVPLMRSRLDALLQGGQSRVVRPVWLAWRSQLEFLRRDPLNSKLDISSLSLESTQTSE